MLSEGASTRVETLRPSSKTVKGSTQPPTHISADFSCDETAQEVPILVIEMTLSSYDAFAAAAQLLVDMCRTTADNASPGLDRSGTMGWEWKTGTVRPFFPQ